MKLAVFRHAEKQSMWETNPGLSTFGEQQAQLLRKRLKEGVMPKPDLLLASPKKRALMTFSPASISLNVPLEMDHELDERRNDESQLDFRKRVSRVLARYTNDSQLTIYLCSHLDWIEEFLTLAPSNTDLTRLRNFSWSPAAYLLFDIEDLWYLKEQGKIE